MADEFVAPSVVVGVDGSANATRAALWAVDEARCREIPLRLIHVSTSPLRAQRTIDRAIDAVQPQTRGVTLEAEIVSGPDVASLADSAAAMICIGNVGSSAAALVEQAPCPIGIIRGPQPSDAANPGAVVVELSATPASAAVLAMGAQEARLRSAPLRVISPRQLQDAYAERHTQIENRLDQWQSRYPDLDVRPVEISGSAMNYVVENSDAIQLLVIGAGDTATAAIRNTSCSILICDRQRLL